MASSGLAKVSAGECGPTTKHLVEQQTGQIDVTEVVHWASETASGEIYSGRARHLMDRWLAGPVP